MRVTTDDLVEYDGKYYFVPIECTILCKIGSNNILEIVDRIPGEYIYNRDSFSKLIIYDDVLFMIPKNGEKLHSFNLKSKEWLTYDLGCSNVKYKFMDALIWDNKIVMIGCYVPNLVLFDLNTQEMKFLNFPYEPFQEIQNKKKDAYYRRGHYLAGDNLYLASSLTNEVCEINLKNQNIKRYTVGNENNTYDGLLYDGGFFWISPRNRSNIVKWNGDDKYINISLPRDENASNCLCLEPISVESLIMIPAYGANNTILLERDGTINSLKSQKYIVVKKIGNITVSITNSGFMEIISKSTKKEIELILNQESNVFAFFSKMDYEIMKTNIEMEKDIYSLKDFLNSIEKYE